MAVATLATLWTVQARADEPSVTVVAVGDIIFGRHHDGVLKPFGDDLFAPTAPILRGADIAFANLETPIAEGPAVLSGGGKGGVIRRGIGWMRFRADPARAKQLAEAGLDIVSTANNHAYDAGREAIPETVRHLTAAGVKAVGSGATPAALVVLERNGLKVGFLAATLVSNRKADPAELSYVDPKLALKELPPRVAAARASVDLLVVSLHWGSEYVQTASASQRMLAQALIDAGADAVIGHHPHVLQGFERYNGKVIAYSLGNFIFDMAAPEKRETALLQLKLSRTSVTAQVIPALIDNNKTPAPARAAAAAGIAKKLQTLSKSFRTLLTSSPDGKLAIEQATIAASGR